MDPLVVFFVSGDMFEGARPFPLKYLIQIKSTSGEFILYIVCHCIIFDVMLPPPPQFLQNILS